MKKISKKLIAMVLSIVLLVSIVPITALAATTVDSGKFGNNLNWSLNSDGVLTISGKGSTGDFEEEFPPWFGYAERITSIVINDGVTSIGNYVFALSSEVKKVTLPSSVTSIGDYAFAFCVSLQNIKFPGNLKSIGEGAFAYDVSLEGVTLPNGLEYIGDVAFQGCASITAVNVTKNLEIIGFGAFTECYSLEKFTVDSNNPNYSAGDNGILYIKDKSALLVAPASLKGDYTVPDTIKTIDSFAFTNCIELERVTVPASVDAIGLCAFLGAVQLKAVNVHPDNKSYTSDENGVLFNKTKSNLICVPSGMTGTYTIPEGVQLIDTYALTLTEGLTEVIIPDSVTEIGYYAFDSSGIRTITIPKNVIFIGDGAFVNCNSLNYVYFEGDAPELGTETPVFGEIITRAYYPEGNTTWTSTVKESFGGSVSWNTYVPKADSEQGDVNLDGEITNADIIMVARYIVGLETNEDVKKYGDMDNDGNVTNSDLIALARIIVGL